MATNPAREQIIRAAWAERGSKLWKSYIHGKGAPLNIQASIEMRTPRPGQPMPTFDNLEFRVLRATMNGQPVDQVVCEEVVVAMLP